MERLGLGADRYAVMETPIGPVYVLLGEHGVTEVTRTLPRRRGRHRVPLPTRLRFDLSGLTPFEQKVLRKAAEIPAGQVRTYTWVAREIGHPAAVRAVGSALGRNPMPLVIPCHRVVRTDGTIGDFIYGTPAKKTLLAREGVDLDVLGDYWGSDTTRIFCFPTCRAARRITDRHRVPFRSTDHARRSGYRPCKLCRPAAA
jgi:O-6-methylguanine DNA methyltransferase